MRACWLALVACACAHGGRAAPGDRPSTVAFPIAPGVEIEPVSERVVVHRSVDAHGVPSNGLVALTDGGLVLVDTAWTEVETEAILAWAERRFGRPFVGAVITHEHADRDGGLGALVRRGIPVAALDLTVAKLAARGVHGVGTLLTAAAGHVADPRGFEVFYPGAGHAADNIVLAFTADDVLFGGCLVKAANAPTLGFTGDADLAAWPAAVQRVADRYPNLHVTVPGHGPVAHGDAALRHTLDLLAAARN